MPASIDWTQLIGQGGFVFFAVAFFVAILYVGRRFLDDVVKPSFGMFRDFLQSLTVQVERMAESNELNAECLKKLTDTQGTFQMTLADVDRTVKMMAAAKLEKQ